MSFILSFHNLPALTAGFPYYRKHEWHDILTLDVFISIPILMSDVVRVFNQFKEGGAHWGILNQ